MERSCRYDARFINIFHNQTKHGSLFSVHLLDLTNQEIFEPLLILATLKNKGKKISTSISDDLIILGNRKKVLFGDFTKLSILNL